MAKQTPEKKPAPKKETAPQGKSSDYWMNNAIIIVSMASIFFLAYNINSKRGELQGLYNEFDDLKEQGGDQQRMGEIYRRIKEIEIDTPYYKMLTIGYFEEIRYIAMGVNKQIEEVRASVNNGNTEGPVTREDKLAYKVGVYPLLDYVNQNTPRNAVILLPPTDSLSFNSKWNYLYDPNWVEYFIYPRLCVTTGAEKDHPDLAKRVTHVLIVKGIGYDKLNYDVPVEQQLKVAVLPIEQPDTLRIR